MDTLVVHVLALAASAAGAFSLYLGAPRQQMLARPLPLRPALGGGLMLLLTGWLLWSVVWHPATAFFALLTVCMTLFTVLPGALALARRKGAA